MRIRDARAAAGTFVPGVLDGVAEREAGPWLQQRHGLQALIGAAGLSTRRRTAYDWDGRRRGDAAFALFQYTIAGGGRLTYGGATRTVAPGTALLLTMPGDHRYWLPPGGSWRFFYLCLHGPEVMRAWRAAMAGAGALVALAPDDRLVAAAAEACAATLAGELTAPYRNAAHAYRLSLLLLDRCAEPAAGRRARGADDALAAAAAHARAHFRDELSVDGLARVAGMSRAHFTRRFAAAFGLAPAAYVADQRLRHAAALLRERELPIADIAAACGYRDPAYFGRAFRRALGISPGAFRTSGMYG